MSRAPARAGPLPGAEMGAVTGRHPLKGVKNEVTGRRSPQLTRQMQAVLQPSSCCKTAAETRAGKHRELQ